MNRETTVPEFFLALEAGYEPKNYSYYKEDVPLGNYKAKLDFMLWSKTYMAINCFFTVKDSLKMISLSVYKKPGEDGLYLTGDTEVRFVPFGSVMQLTVEANQNGKPILVDAAVEGNVADGGALYHTNTPGLTAPPSVFGGSPSFLKKKGEAEVRQSLTLWPLCAEMGLWGILRGFYTFLQQV